MSKKFILAGESEDDALRAILRNSTVPSDISLAFIREPSYFINEKAGNICSQTIIYRDENSGDISAIGGRSIRKVFIDGIQEEVGYLNSLRIVKGVQSKMVLARGYAFLRTLHQDQKASFYLTTILDENKYAKQILESERAGMPIYKHVGDLMTYMLPIRRKVFKKVSDSIVSCGPDNLATTYDCLNLWNKSHQFSPSYSESDDLPDFRQSDLLVKMEGNKAVGTFGVWNQQSFRQIVVADYSTRMKIIKPVYNVYASARGFPRLPNIGQSVKCVYGNMVSSEENNPEIFGELVKKACYEWSGKGFDYLMIGLVEGNKLSPVVDRLACRKLRSKIYIVHWRDDNVLLPRSMDNIHLELSIL